MNDKIKDIVEEVLKETKESRDSDFLLIMKVYIKLGYARRIPLGIVIEYKNIEDAPSFETITRIRREIQNTENRLRATEEVEQKRQEHRKEVKYNYSPKNMNQSVMANGWMS